MVSTITQLEVGMATKPKAATRIHDAPNAPRGGYHAKREALVTVLEAYAPNRDAQMMIYNTVIQLERTLRSGEAVIQALTRTVYETVCQGAPPWKE